MNFSIIPTQSFLREVKHLSKKYASLKNDLKGLGEALSADHKLGTPMGKNCYKIRLQITSKGKGKSGGARIITHLIASFENETVYLLKIYDKSDQENISDNELNQLLAEIK